MTTYHRHPDLRLTALDGEGVVLHLGTLRYFTVNDTGLTILKTLDTPCTLSQLVEAVVTDFDVTNELAEVTTRDFLSECLRSGLVSERA